MAYNGLYTHHSTHEGWPVLRNAKGFYCYRYAPVDQWYLSDEFAPDGDSSFAAIVAKGGALPVGAHTWWCWVDGEWKERTLTATLQ